MPTIVPTRRSASTNEDRETERRRLAGAEEWDRLGARRVYAYGLLGVAAVQLAVADAAVLIYGFYNDWRIPSRPLMAGWGPRSSKSSAR
jgi:hypothetical protein